MASMRENIGRGVLEAGMQSSGRVGQTFHWARRVHQTETVEVWDGQSSTGQPAIMVLLAPGAVDNQAARASFADAVRWAERPDVTEVTLLAADAIGAKPWVALVADPRGWAFAERFLGPPSSGPPAPAPAAPIAPPGSPVAPSSPSVYTPPVYQPGQPPMQQPPVQPPTQPPVTPPPPQPTGWPVPAAPTSPWGPIPDPVSGPAAPANPPPLPWGPQPPPAGFAPGGNPPGAPGPGHWPAQQHAAQQPAAQQPAAQPSAPNPAWGPQQAAPVSQSWDGHVQPVRSPDIPPLPGPQELAERRRRRSRTRVGLIAGAVLVLAAAAATAAFVLPGRAKNTGGTPTASTSPSSSPSPTPIPRPTFQQSAAPVAVLGGTWQPGEATKVQDFAEWPFAFRTPAEATCEFFVGEPAYKAHNCKWNTEPNHTVMAFVIRRCVNSCDATEQAQFETMTPWKPDGTLAATDPTTKFVSVDYGDGRQQFTMVHYFGTTAGGPPQWVVIVQGNTPTPLRDPVLKTMNDVRSQTP
jgi:hypothetical protein